LNTIVDDPGKMKSMDEIHKLTEKDSPYRHLEKMSVQDILFHINQEDHEVPKAVQRVLPQIGALVSVVTDRLLAGGRLFYIGAGTSGRLGVVDASECPPTFGVPHGLVVGIIAGGEDAMFKAVEFAEDSTEDGWKDLKNHGISSHDVVIGIAASGTTPYVISALEACRKNGIITGSITCNPHAPVSKASDFPIEVVVGPEFVTGSTRMKSGTAQKLVLNMISTAVMIQLGRVQDNKMVHMQLTNDKLVDRGAKMVMSALGLEYYEVAKELLLRHGSVKLAVEAGKIGSAGLS
jgi:N-acetylmuramic acid 6-phosphate etherase